MTELSASTWENKYTRLYQQVEVFHLPLRFIVEGETSVCQAVHDKNFTFLRRAGLNVDDIAMFQINSDMDQGLSESNILRRANKVYQENYRHTRVRGEVELEDRFGSFTELLGNYQTLYAQFDAEYQRDLRHVISINETIIALLDIERQLDKHQVQRTDTGLSKIRYLPSFNGSQLTVEDLLVLFDKINVGPSIPYVLYNQYSKIYDVAEDISPSLEYIQLKKNKTQKPDVLYFTIWSGELVDSYSLKNSLKRNFVLASYHPSKGELTVSVVGQNDVEKGRIVERLNEAFEGTDVILGEEAPSPHHFSYNIFGVEYDDTSLLDAMLTIPVFYTLIYVNEQKGPQAVRKGITLHYSPLGSTAESREQDLLEQGVSLEIKCKLSLIVLTEDKYISVKGEVVTIPTGTPYVNLYITNALSEEQSEEFLRVLEILFRFYSTVREEILEVYRQAGAITASEVRSSSTITQTSKKVSNLKYNVSQNKYNRLQLEDPLYFSDANSTNYTTDCQCPWQPIPISTDEEEDWRNTLFLGKDGQYHERDVVAFPPDRKPTITLVCPNDDRPYVHMKSKKLTTGKDFYPQIPCCGTSKEYHARERAKKYKSKSVKEFSTNKVSPVDHASHLPQGVSLFLDAEIPSEYSTRRYGVPVGPNSLIHCLCSVNDEDYMSYDFEDREDYVRRLRVEIFRCTPATVKQELYDEEDIVTLLKNLETSEERIDADLYYRALEEYFEVNIFVFRFPPQKIEGELGSIRPPRCMLYHTRSIRNDRETALVIENESNRAEGLEYPHYEPIVMVSEKGGILARFDKDIADICVHALIKVFEIKSWDIDREEEEDVPGYYFGLGELRNKAVGQVIDSFGKTRVVILDDGAVLHVLPMQPLTVPILYEIPQSNVTARDLEYLGRPQYRGDSGLWFELGETAGGTNRPDLVYIPVQGLLPGPVEGGLPFTGDVTVLLDYDPVTRSRDMRWQINLILQVSVWLLDLSGLSVPDFMDQYTHTNQEENSSYYYRLSGIPQVLPEVTMQEALDFLHGHAETLVQNNLMQLYNEKFRDRLQEYLTRHVPDPNKGNVLQGYYRDASDFVSNPQVTVFFDREQYSLFQQKRSEGFQVAEPGNTILSSESIQRGEPIIYSYGGSDYLVQGVLDGNLYLALTVATIWRDERYNVGFNPQRYPDVIILTAEDEIRWTPYELELGIIQGSKNEGLGVLLYSEGKYAALLPLLAEEREE